MKRVFFVFLFLSCAIVYAQKSNSIKNNDTLNVKAICEQNEEVLANNDSLPVFVNNTNNLIANTNNILASANNTLNVLETLFGLVVLFITVATTIGSWKIWDFNSKIKDMVSDVNIRISETVSTVDSKLKDIDHKVDSKLKDIDHQVDSKLKDIDCNVNSKLNDVNYTVENKINEQTKKINELTKTIEEQKEIFNNNIEYISKKLLCVDRSIKSLYKAFSMIITTHEEMAPLLKQVQISNLFSIEDKYKESALLYLRVNGDKGDLDDIKFIADNDENDKIKKLANQVIGIIIQKEQQQTKDNNGNHNKN